MNFEEEARQLSCDHLGCYAEWYKERNAHVSGCDELTNKITSALQEAAREEKERIVDYLMVQAKELVKAANRSATKTELLAMAGFIESLGGDLCQATPSTSSNSSSPSALHSSSEETGQDGETKSDQAYQVIGRLASYANCFTDPEVQRALDYFSEDKFDPDFPPFIIPAESTQEPLRHLLVGLEDMAEFYAHCAKTHDGVDREILMAKGQGIAEAICHLRVRGKVPKSSPQSSDEERSDESSNPGKDHD